MLSLVCLHMREEFGLLNLVSTVLILRRVIIADQQLGCLE